ncbi:MAG: PIN domain-containing protein [Candidatus Riflebacteria bacterium]|nr:PIN domain-containing protein [Candidatus Riflebacteria bacterium]
MSFRVILDTNVFIDYLRTGAHAEWVAGQVEGTVRFLSAVVLMELRLGADTPPRKRAVDRLKSAFPESRIVAPGPDLYDRAGWLFRRVHGAGGGLGDRLGAVDDLLIALTAWRIGARVVTSNTRDFLLIARHLHGLVCVTPTASVP